MVKSLRSVAIPGTSSVLTAGTGPCPSIRDDDANAVKADDVPFGVTGLKQELQRLQHELSQARIENTQLQLENTVLREMKKQNAIGG